MAKKEQLLTSDEEVVLTSEGERQVDLTDDETYYDQQQETDCQDENEYDGEDGEYEYEEEYETEYA